MKSKIHSLIATSALCLSTLNVASAAIKPMGLLSDGAILQRQKPIPLWGWAEPGESVTVTLNGQTGKGVANADGKWTIHLPAMDAAMDLTMEITGSETAEPIEIKDVAIGEVWLASGQSNMQWSLQSVDMTDIADLPTNRMIREGRASGTADFREPSEQSRGIWYMDTPENRPKFSAVAYYFAQRLQAELDVPVGFITAAVGGTAVEPWTPREVVDSIRPIWSKEYWDAYESHPELVKDFVADADLWLERYQRVDTAKALDPKADLAPAADQPWQTIDPYKEFPEGFYSGYGVLWMRKTISVDADQISEKRTYFRLYTKDCYPEVYLNGKKIHNTTIENSPGKNAWINCSIEPGMLQSGENEILVRMYSPFVPLNFDRAYSIDGMDIGIPWEAQVEVDFRAPSEAATADMPISPERRVGYGRLPAVHFNRFIAPITGYSLRGAIWYQGETNAQQREIEEYALVFPAMIQAWRDLWGNPEMSFYYCQLAAYGGKTGDPSVAGWAPFRRSQEAALELPHTGQAVLIDVGESDIHPYDKVSVGDRLARLALANDYGLDVIDSGPVVKSATVNDTGVVSVEFNELADGLVAQPLPETYAVSKKKQQYRPFVRFTPDSQLEGFALQDAAGKWHWANAAIDGDLVKVHSAAAPQPTAIRYNWQSYPNGNLSNSEGLPTTPFELSISQK